MKEEGYQMVGYVRKSPRKEAVGDRIRLLQYMISRLKERSRVDKVFMSTCCNSNDPIAERDMKFESEGDTAAGQEDRWNHAR
jgi:hypothetical protein